ncbi:MAG: substrate-binding domain-containing protein [Actinomycetota bacterium]|nr:substrate-binding domain-containing protein [Actinomycetota bacterium]MDA8047464.1 substrate-binding domain-containing protein [Actinomycetota bacterium]MDA8284998.1 substrate-binding domain-containing protein [Actinomycetota bacterium]
MQSHCRRAAKGRLKGSSLLGMGSLAVAGLLAASGTFAGASSTVGPKAAHATGHGANLALVKSQLAAATKPLSFIVPGPAFNAKKLAGKTVFNMPSDTADPFYTPITQAMQQAANAAHLKLITFANQGTTSEWVQGMDQAISQHVGAIVLGGIDPAVIAPQIKEAEAHHIVVEESHEYQKGVKTPSILSGNSFGAFAQAAHLMADYAIAKTSGHAHVLIITDNAYPNSVTMYDSMVSTFKSECGSGCTVTAVNEPITNWASGIQPAVESALTSNPNINWVLPVYDSMSEYIVPGIEAKGAASKVSVASFNGTPFVLKYIEDPSSDQGIVKMDAGENTALIGWQAIDQSMRLMEGLPAAPNDTTAIRIFDGSNVRLTGTPPALGKGYGPASYITGFEKLWGYAK